MFSHAPIGMRSSRLPSSFLVLFNVFLCLFFFKNQMFIGHSQPVRQVNFTPDQLGVVSVGDAIFLWDFLAYPVDALTDSR